MKRSACAVALLICLLGATNAWKVGRATFYGTDAWSIHQGSCEYYYLDKNVGVGWDVGALSDSVYDYGGACGRCYAVRCKNMSFKDGYGETLDRTGVCYDESREVKIQIVDTCPCQYPGNAFSNSRWCCGDQYHIDLSAWAFEKLAPLGLGVIAIEYRVIDCASGVGNPAPQPANPSSGPHDSPPHGWSASMDKRPFATSMYGAAPVQNPSPSPSPSPSPLPSPVPSPEPVPELVPEPVQPEPSPSPSLSGSSTTVDGQSFPICSTYPTNPTTDIQGRTWGFEGDASCLVVEGTTAPEPAPKPSPTAATRAAPKPTTTQAKTPSTTQTKTPTTTQAKTPSTAKDSAAASGAAKKVTAEALVAAASQVASGSAGGLSEEGARSFVERFLG